MKKSRIYDYDVLRLIATLLVVMGHCMYLTIGTKYGGVQYSLPYNTDPVYYSPIFNFFNSAVGYIYKFHMPLFFILSGACYGISKTKPFKTLYVNKFKRLMIPFFVYGLLFMLPVKFFAGFYSGEKLFPAISDFVLGFGGDTGHLWFLTALFWVFIIFRCIEKVSDNKLLIILAICFVLQLRSDIIPFDFFQLGKGMSYVFWFALGFSFQKVRDKLSIIINKNSFRVVFFMLMSVVASLEFNYFANVNSYLSIIIRSLWIYSIALLICIFENRFVESKLFKSLSKHNIYIYIYSTTHYNM